MPRPCDLRATRREEPDQPSAWGERAMEIPTQLPRWKSREELIIGLLLLLGAGLRLWQYLGNPGLWMDELAVANNVLTRPLAVLLREPLADGQIAPPGFLIAVRAAVVAFGPSEYALRL